MTLPKDKVLHFIGGVIIYLFVFVVTHNHGLALLMSALIGLLKEAWDKQGHGTPEVMDFVSTAAGGAFCFVLFKANL